MPSNNCRLSSLSCHSRTIFIFATQSTHTNIWIAHSFPLRILIWTNLPFNRQKFDRLQHHIVANVNAVYDISIDWFIYYFFFVIWRHSCRKVIEFIQLRSIHVLIHKTLCSRRQNGNVLGEKVVFSMSSMTCFNFLIRTILRCFQSKREKLIECACVCVCLCACRSFPFTNPLFSTNSLQIISCLYVWRENFLLPDINSMEAQEWNGLSSRSRREQVSVSQI